MPFLLFLLLALESCFGEITVKAGDIIKKLEKGESVEMKDAVVVGVLDFSEIGKLSPVSTAMAEARVKANFFCLRCVFKEKVVAKKNNAYTRFDGNVIFLESEFQKDVDFSNAVIYGTVNFTKSIFKENAIFYQMAVWSKDSDFSEITANKKFSFDVSSFQGNLSFFDAKFLGSFSLQEVFVLGILQSSKADFGGKTDFAMLKTGGRAIFQYTKFKYEPDFSDIKVEK
ncbi:MAG: pentapeptide repeat-containing protein [Fibromonadales bacterium]|nr:pentapeptide repeat-containing protein [Fibromonadales bacterium]